MDRSDPRQDFNHWLRTGRNRGEPDRPQAQFKFNPWHDPDNGRFTFANAGSEGAARRPHPAGPAPTAPSPIQTAHPPAGSPRGSSSPGSGRARTRAVPGYPQDGANAWRAANDAIFERAADAFNQRNGLKPGDPRYVEPQFLKAWAMVESGGSKDAFLTDPFQVNKNGDWDREKAKIGLVKGQKPMPSLSASAALQWLDMKSHPKIAIGGGKTRTEYIGLRRGLARYNGNHKIDSNGQKHSANYVAMVIALAGK